MTYQTLNLFGKSARKHCEGKNCIYQKLWKGMIIKNIDDKHAYYHIHGLFQGERAEEWGTVDINTERFLKTGEIINIGRCYNHPVLIKEMREIMGSIINYSETDCPNCASQKYCYARCIAYEGNGIHYHLDNDNVQSIIESYGLLERNNDTIIANKMPIRVVSAVFLQFLYSYSELKQLQKM